VIYKAAKTVKATEPYARDSSLDMHELHPDGGRALCRIKPGTWEGIDLIWREFGEGEVTCIRCAQISGHAPKRRKRKW
jgi:hypothetical protein